MQAGNGPPRPMQVVWPAANAAAASLAWSGGAAAQQESGPWALFRLFARATMSAAGPDRTGLVFRDGEREARFEMRLMQNPFTNRALQEFRCPTLQ